LILAIRDMQVAAFAAEAAGKLPEKDGVREALVAAAIVAYARPFASGRSWGRVSSKWEKFEDQALQEIHHFVCTWRDSVIAHNDEELNDVEFFPKGSYMDFKPDGNDTAIRLTSASHGEFMRTPVFPSEMLAPFARMCGVQQHRMKEDANREKDALFVEFIRPTTKGS